MRNLIKLVGCFAFAAFVSACQSNEQKAEMLIKSYMKATLYDYESYEPVLTNLDSLPRVELFGKMMPKVEKIIEARESVEEINQKINFASIDVRHAKSSMALWRDMKGSYARAEYQNAKDEYNLALENEKKLKGNLVEKENEIKRHKQDILALFQDTTAYIESGWVVLHRFKCNTRGGDASIGEYVFIANNDFDTIYYTIDAEDPNATFVLQYISEELKLDMGL